MACFRGAGSYMSFWGFGFGGVRPKSFKDDGRLLAQSPVWVVVPVS